MGHDHPRVLIAFEPPTGGVRTELATRGHQVVGVDAGDRDLESIAGQPFDLCVIWAHDSEAIDLCRRVRRTPRGAVTPVLIVGGVGHAVDDLPGAVAAGADAFVEEGEGLQELLARIAGLLGVPSAEEPAEPSPSTADPVVEALTAAEAVGTVADDLRAPLERGSPSAGETSLSELIDRVERQLRPTLEPGEGGEPALPEDLDALDIEADLGRPAEPGEELSEAPEGGLPEDPEEPLRAEPREDGRRAAEQSRAADSGTEDVATAPLRTAAGPASGDGGVHTRGRIEDERLWSLLARALAERWTGVLAVRSRGVERRLFLEEGEPLLAVSSAREDRLIELLYREGRLSEEQYQRASLTVSESGRRVGVVLVERGLIASRELFPLVRHHYEMLIFDSFGWREGEFEFQDGERSRGERILLDVPGAALIVEGLRSRANAADVDQLVPPGACPLQLGSGIRSLEEVGLAPAEQRLLEDCDGTNTTADLGRLHDLPEQEVRALFAGLVVLGWLRIDGGAQPAAAGPVARPSYLGPDADSRVERARVADKLSQVAEASYFALMEVPPDATGHEIRKSYRRLRGQFAPERFAVSDLADLREQVEVIRVVLDEAYEILRDATLREAYRQALAERP